jgi:predicted dithiol-disulfide oxidoreductase (DUF899 family)
MKTNTTQIRTGTGLKEFKVVSSAQWLKARQKLLAKEKEFTKLRDQLSRQRRTLPWERVEKDYVFDGPNGKESLAELFAGKTQLIVYHFMFAPEDDEGCRGCSFWADNFNGIPPHLRARDTSFVAISRAPYKKLKAYQKRMGWNFKWLSADDNGFPFDYHASYTPEEVAGKALFNFEITQPWGEDMPGISVFCRDRKGRIYRTYSCYIRGIDMMNTAYHYLDLTPKGRDEENQKPHPMAWVRRHDAYGK